MENGRLWARLTAMIPSLEESHAAPWLLWGVESSQEPVASWYQGWLGELYHYKDGTFNMLSSAPSVKFCCSCVLCARYLHGC